jgi:hypothetical protein
MSKGIRKHKTYVGVVLDRSTSMWSIRSATVDAFNRTVQDIREQSAGQDVSVSLWTFANDSQNVFFNASVDTLRPLTYDQYIPRGNTAMFDGVCNCIDAFGRVPGADDPEVAFLVIVITDGEENYSSSVSKGRIHHLMLDRQKTDRWTFAFQVPPGLYKENLVSRFGVPTDNVLEWTTTEQGVRLAQKATGEAAAQYFAARSTGKTKVAAFYATTDLSDVSDADLRDNLTDIRDRFKVYEVPKECRIDEFLSSKTRKPYVVGSGYYQLMKRETIQPHKQVLIMKKGEKSIWGGREARHLIGLPDGADAKTTPGNHSSYDIFVQSKAPNRKLPRGTRVLLDLEKKKADDATWDFEAAQKAAEAKRAAQAPAAIC